MAGKDEVPLVYRGDRVGTVVFAGAGSRPNSVELLFNGPGKDAEINWDGTLASYGSGGWASVKEVLDHNGDPVPGKGQIQI
jgi:hypothetical protein